MKSVLQRVSEGAVTVDGECVGSIERGIVALVGFGEHDTASTLKPMAEKIFNLRIFSNENGRFHFSLLDIKGDILLVPQFTLFADTSKGRRPEFFGAMNPAQATLLFDEFKAVCSGIASGKVQSGIFGADMKVALINDGPVTISLEMP